MLSSSDFASVAVGQQALDVCPFGLGFHNQAALAWIASHTTESAFDLLSPRLLLDQLKCPEHLVGIENLSLQR